MRHLPSLGVLPALLISSHAIAGGVQPSDQSVQQIVVEGSRDNGVGIADSATQGTVTAKQLENRPLLRTGELLETVPGVIVTQHSGDGKANQYFARGFNLDHGTDFRTTVLGMPVNMPTNAHGQGYSDLNFVIPELVKTIQYKKGTYYAEEGDFSAAGAAVIDYVRTLDQGLLSVELGQNGYRRTVVANSTAMGPGDLLYAFEGAGNDGPWTNPENYKRFNGVLSYSWKAGNDAFRVAAMALQSSWNSTDQVPQRAIASGRVDRFGAIDPTDGGDAARYSLSADWTRRHDDGITRANAYFVKSRLNLFSNFTYALDDPTNGDQFQQSEQRSIAGLNTERTFFHNLGRFEAETTAGLQLRQDMLSPVALYATASRQRLSTTREDDVTERATALFVTNTTRWLPWFRTVAGLRSDWYDFDVKSSNPANSGKVSASILSPKFSSIFSLSRNAEFYLNWGKGFHSNDARGITTKVDPKTGLATDADGNPVVPATPLVKAIGKEAGLRLTGLVPGLQTSLSVWQLDLASELVFSGDAGTTEASRPSHRNGIELANYYVPAKGWIIDADVAWSRARFTDNDPAGPYIPGAIDRTASIGLSGEHGKWSGGLHVRYFGGRALVEDNSVRSSSSTLVNAKLGYAIRNDVKLTVDVLNLLNRQVSDIDYFYQSRLAGEAVPVNDIHTHPAEPRTMRVGVVMKF
jgi:outer membrane cobalamin receptor